MKLKSRIRFHVKGFVGITLGLFAPGRRKVVERYATIPGHYKKGFTRLDQIIRAGLFYRNNVFFQEKNKVEDLHKNFWKKQDSNEYYENTKNRFKDTFLPKFSVFLDALDGMIVDKELQAVCEIGTGDGQLLNYLSKRWPSVDCVGLDLSESQIRNNKKNYKNPNITFHAIDAIHWIGFQESRPTIYMTGLGVFEYFDYESLLKTLDSIKCKHTDNVLFLTEPVYNGANMDEDFVSFSGGREYSFTHAYPKILEREGWQLIVNEFVSAIEHRFWVGIAVQRSIL